MAPSSATLPCRCPHVKILALRRPAQCLSGSCSCARHGTVAGLPWCSLRAAVAEALTRGFSHMRLWTPEGAARARRFYEREGWTLTGRVHRRSDFGLPMVEYGRDIR